MLKYVVCLSKGYDGCCVFYLYCDAWSCMCSCIGSMTVSSCRYCMFASCVYPVAVLNLSAGWLKRAYNSNRREAGRYLFIAVNVWWRCVQYFVIASCG